MFIGMHMNERLRGDLNATQIVNGNLNINKRRKIRNYVEYIIQVSRLAWFY